MTARAAVTGATGFIGWHVCERLRDAGWHVAAVVRPESTKKSVPAKVERLCAPLETDALARACSDVSVIIHAAGITRAQSSEEYHRVNVAGTRAVALAAHTLKARLVHISSLTAAGPAPVDRPRTEEDASAPITAYGRSKRDSEQVIAGVSGLRWTVIRPAAVYGPRDRQFLPLFQAARRGLLPRPSNADAFSMTFAHVDDVARAIATACNCEDVDRETLFIGHPEPASLDALLSMIAQAVQRSYRPVPVPWWLVRLGASIGVGGLSGERLREMTSPGFVCRVERAERRLGFRAAVGLAEGLESTADWYLANHWLS
jgi:nucleoside-diphosphate-sugar epimerase